ncbi:MAG: hypothetical protein ABEJ75_01820 [Candidatus Nanohaloarchaea archaeon]
MAGPKSIGTLLLIAGLLIAPAGATRFKVQISELTSFNQVAFDAEDDADPLNTFNTSVANTGSVGCVFRLKGVYSHSGETVERWSQGYALWPGETALMEINYLPYNYTGEVNATIELSYCGQTATLQNYSFTSREGVVANHTVETTTLESNSSAARVKLGVENGTMVPYSTPAGWKVHAVDIKDGRATVQYEPYLFHSQREILYAVMKDGRVVGTATVNVAAQTTILERVQAHALEILLLLSAALNLVLIAKHPSARETLLKPLK